MKETKRHYVPIACSSYEQIELIIMQGDKIDLTFINAEGETKSCSKVSILDTSTSDKAEYIITDMESHSLIRMDHIVSINDHEINYSCNKLQ